jgi:hypothetical protein
MILGNLFNKGKGGKVNPPKPAGFGGRILTAVTKPHTAAGAQAGPKLVRAVPPSTPSRTKIAGVKPPVSRPHVPASNFSAISNPSPGGGIKSALGLKGVREVPSQLDTTKISSVIDFAQAGFGRYDAVAAGTGEGGAIEIVLGSITRIPLVASRILTGLSFPDIIPNTRPNMGPLNPNIPVFADNNDQQFETRLKGFCVRVENSGVPYLASGGYDGAFRWQGFGLSLLLYPENLNLSAARPRPIRMGTYRTWLRSPLIDPQFFPIITYASGISSSGRGAIYDNWMELGIYEWNLFGGTWWKPFSQTIPLDPSTGLSLDSLPLLERHDAKGIGELFIPAGFRLDLEIDATACPQAGDGGKLLLDWNATALQVGKNAQLPK